MIVWPKEEKLDPLEMCICRAKSLSSGKWVTGQGFINKTLCTKKTNDECDCQQRGGIAKILIWDDWFHEFNDVAVDISTVRRSVPQCDRTGEQGFIGDIARDERGNKHVIERSVDDNKACLARHYADGSPSTISDISELATQEIIANIIDSPNLL